MEIIRVGKMNLAENGKEWEAWYKFVSDYYPWESVPEEQKHKVYITCEWLTLNGERKPFDTQDSGEYYLFFYSSTLQTDLAELSRKIAAGEYKIFDIDKYRDVLPLIINERRCIDEIIKLTTKIRERLG
jgi:hypothetical protein